MTKLLFRVVTRFPTGHSYLNYNGLKRLFEKAYKEPTTEGRDNYSVYGLVILQGEAVSVRSSYRTSRKSLLIVCITTICPDKLSLPKFEWHRASEHVGYMSIGMGKFLALSR